MSGCVGKSCALVLFVALHLGHCANDGYHEALGLFEDEIEISDDNSTTDYHIVSVTAIKFYLYLPPPYNDTLELNSTNLNLINASQPIKIIVHGVAGFENQVWIDQMVTSYHTKGDYNIIAVDWSMISTSDTFLAVSAVNSVGQVVGNFIVEVTEERTEYLSNVHLIGSGLGAQVSGAAGETVAGRNGSKVGRITGLDPTEPQSLDILDKEDAEFVDTIHTTVFLGEQSCGTVDFYVSGNDSTPICYNGSCVELMADDLYIMTIVEEDRFTGVSCLNATGVEKLCDQVNMGEFVSKNATGSYLVTKGTASTLSFEGKYMLSITLATFIWYLIV
ncbi:hypothetical protein MTP99_003213 [Tenebrio molitor]|nr:hypothetical protein MTP99_003213 [Tenebrio molitor]